MSYKNGIYFGQLDPQWRDNAQKLLDEQSELLRNLENRERRLSLPKEIAIYGGGVLILLTILIIYKYKKK